MVCCLVARTASVSISTVYKNMYLYCFLTKCLMCSHKMSFWTKKRDNPDTYKVCYE